MIHPHRHTTSSSWMKGRNVGVRCVVHSVASQSRFAIQWMMAGNQAWENAVAQQVVDAREACSEQAWIKVQAAICGINVHNILQYVYSFWIAKLIQKTRSRTKRKCREAFCWLVGALSALQPWGKFVFNSISDHVQTNYPIRWRVLKSTKNKRLLNKYCFPLVQYITIQTSTSQQIACLLCWHRF